MLKLTVTFGDGETVRYYLRSDTPWPLIVEGRAISAVRVEPASESA